MSASIAGSGTVLAPPLGSFAAFAGSACRSTSMRRPGRPATAPGRAAQAPSIRGRSSARKWTSTTWAAPARSAMSRASSGVRWPRRGSSNSELFERRLGDEQVRAAGRLDEPVARTRVAGDRDRGARRIGDDAAPRRNVVLALDEPDRQVAHVEAVLRVVLEEAVCVVEEVRALADPDREGVDPCLPVRAAGARACARPRRLPRAAGTEATRGRCSGRRACDR